ncbi:MAG TPA: zf-HC2 domain-containing protein [Terriglobales bacterium]|nr:zf-HC2 domain-containing protein [Terriglobales bacterium]
MPGETKDGMQCAEFDALLTEALDGTLGGERLERFQAHAQACSVCGPLFAEIDAGRRLLKSITEAEPPAHLVHNILAATSGFDTARMHAPLAQPQVSWLDRVRAWMAPTLTPVLAVIRQPRFAMSFGMAFFSVSMVLNLAGVKFSDLRHVDLHPSAIVRGYHMTSGKVVKYYENIRFVYQIESKVREIKRATTPAEPAPQKDQHRKDNNNTSGQPEPRQERNYSQGENQPVLASTPDVPPIAAVTATRRFV